MVDPSTRNPAIPEGDAEEIRSLITDSKTDLVLQNSKFDVSALETVIPGIGRDWPWERTDDTLVAGHVLASNRPHDLTSMGIQYLGVNIEPFEKRLEECVQAARRLARSKYPEWAIAKEGRPDMPSAKEKTWKFDMWLPRRLWEESEDVRKAHPEWETVLAEYSNQDSGITLPLWFVQKKELERRGLWAIYKERLKCMRLAYRLETNGVTVSRPRLEARTSQFREESEAAGRVCVNIARSMGHELELPKGAAVNGSLRTFCFGESCAECGGAGWFTSEERRGICTACKGSGEGPRRFLDLERFRGKKSKTDAPTLDKETMAHYLLTLDSRSKALAFVRNLLGKRGRDTAIAFMAAYERFWVETPCPGSYRLHPSLNPTSTNTLRWTSSNPNEQNISKREDFNVRVCFGPAPGREWWSLDAKNIELRLPFYESGEQSLIDLFERPDDPPYYGSNHLANFHAVYPDVWEEVEREVGFEKVGPTCKKRFASTWYQWCKNGGFAKQYGGQRKKVDATFKKEGAFDLLDSKFSRLASLNQWCIRFANKHGYIETLPDKTVDPTKGYPLLCTRTEQGKILETVPLSYRVQGSAMWWTHKAMVRCDAQLEQWHRQSLESERYLRSLQREALSVFDGFITMQVHDEMVFDFPRRGDPVAEAKGEAPPGSSNLSRIRRLQELMAEGGRDYGIPTPVGVEYHPENWGEGITL